MAGADPFGDPEAESTAPPEQQFVNKPIWQRLLILLGGPAANIILPIHIFSVVAMSGESVPGSVVGQVVNDSPAQAAGFLPKDKIVAVDDNEIKVWSDLEWFWEMHRNDTTRCRGKRRSPCQSFSSSKYHSVNGGERTSAEKFGLMHRQVHSRIGVSDPSSPAATAGLRTGDAVVAVDGKTVTTWAEMMGLLSAGRPHTLDVKRAHRDKAEIDIESLTFDLREIEGWSPREGEFFDNVWGLAPVDVYRKGHARQAGASRQRARSLTH